DVVAALVALELFLCLGLEATVFARDELFRTAEGISARLLVFLPGAVLLTRNAFYTATDAWRAALVGAPALSLLVLPRLWGLTKAGARALQALGALGLCVAAGLLVPAPGPLCLVVSVVLLVASELAGTVKAGFEWGATGFLAAAGVASFLDASPACLIAT